MAFDLVLEDTDEVKCKESLQRNGIRVSVKVTLIREALVAKDPEEDKLVLQSTTKVNIDVLITAINLKVESTGSALLRNVQEFKRVGQKIKVINVPEDSAMNAARLYTNGLTLSLTKELLAAAFYPLPLFGRSKLGKALDQLGDYAQEYAAGMSVKMNVVGRKPSKIKEQSKLFCETKMTLHKMVLPIFRSARNATTDGHVPRGGQKVTKL